MQLYHGNKHTYRLSFIALRQVHQLIETVTLYKTNHDNSGTTCTTGWSGLVTAVPYLSCTDMWGRVSVCTGVRHKNSQSSVVWICRGDELIGFCTKSFKRHMNTAKKQQQQRNKNKIYRLNESLFLLKVSASLSPESSVSEMMVRLIHLFPVKVYQFFEASSGKFLKREKPKWLQVCFLRTACLTLVFVFTQKLWSSFFLV